MSGKREQPRAIKTNVTQVGNESVRPTNGCHSASHPHTWLESTWEAIVDINSLDGWLPDPAMALSRAFNGTESGKGSCW